ncbi:MKRN2 opposite strand protein-like [Anneissia japonica]|uniref:MKRN2 opposite strand protein-like n=1 Tax=Anneissia japonica TaxID=1529436 RepID=UPI0014255D83|nr:MKRN2 opposite strand protein-like [Anneissia japonica]
MVSILKFVHCESAEIFCFNIPAECPICGADLSSRLRSPPIAIPTPFVNGTNIPCSVLVKPTVGGFLRDYKNGSNLHTGVSDSKGCIFNYDEDGMHLDTDSNSWKDSLAIPVVDLVDEELKDVWDKRLHSMATQSSWQATRYHPDLHNCFDFVVNFLNCVEFNVWNEKSNEPITRTQFSTAYILPATSRAARYIGLYRSIQLHGSVTHK